MQAEKQWGTRALTAIQTDSTNSNDTTYKRGMKGHAVKEGYAQQSIMIGSLFLGPPIEE